MRWTKSDLDLYFSAEEYVDTLLLPLLPISLEDNSSMEKSSIQSESMSIFVNQMEKLYKGRIFLFPTYNYLSSADLEKETARLNEWVSKAMDKPFQHVFFFTFDHHWKKHERNLEGNLLWLPAIQSGDMHAAETQNIIKEQIAQITELIKSYW
ncbi:DUF2487 family protein [Sediminibacillus massiliensis]|uniref:DUF2487 family protein n=1 Tax=Sediminibacillus massiliensis TaxID=1926277 RepID=UPI0009883F8A|nr:DUF2487 family protein [Sediminibacillus massiliensis]